MPITCHDNHHLLVDPFLGMFPSIPVVQVTNHSCTVQLIYNPSFQFLINCLEVFINEYI